MYYSTIYLQKLEDIFGSGQPVSYAYWIAFCTPLMVANLILAFFLLSFVQWICMKRATRPDSNGDDGNALHMQQRIPGTCACLSADCNLAWEI